MAGESFSDPLLDRRDELSAHGAHSVGFVFVDVDFFDVGGAFDTVDDILEGLDADVGGDGIDKHNDEEDGGEPDAEAGINVGGKLEERREEEIVENGNAEAPKQRRDEGDTAMEVEGFFGVIPPANAEETLEDDAD